MAGEFAQQVTQAQNTKRSAEGARAEAWQARSGIPAPSADRLISQGDQQLAAGNSLLARGHPADAIGQYAAAARSFNQATADAERKRAALDAAAAQQAAALQAAAAAAQQAQIAAERQKAAAEQAAARGAAQKAAAAHAVQAALNAKKAAAAANTRALKTISAQPRATVTQPAPTRRPTARPTGSKPSTAFSPAVTPSKPPLASVAVLSSAAIDAWRKAKAAGMLRQLWLRAERQQETGYPNGRYDSNTPGAYGAYSWNDLAGWANMARDAGFAQYAGRPPADAPDSVQDAVAWHFMGPYVDSGNLMAAAEVWNGGVPYSIPNPVLGSTAVYADEVISKFEALVAQLEPVPSGGGSGIRPAPLHGGRPAGPQPAAPVSSNAWNGNPEGVQLQAAFQNLHDTLSKWNPGFRHQLQLIASRPIGG
jgi:hypothetical protein